MKSNPLLNPRCDATFKAIFTGIMPQSKVALKSFLEAFLEAEVSDIKLIQNELSIESEKDKQASFDITCMLNKTEAVNIEMQKLNAYSSYDKRAEYNAAHLLNHFTPKGTNWKSIPKVYQISVLDFIYDKASDNPFSVYTMKTEDNRSLSSRQTIIFIELQKLISDNEDIKKLTPKEKWAKFLLYADDIKKQSFIKNLCKSEVGIMAANEALREITQDDIEWVAQTSRDKAYRDYISGIEDAEERGIQKNRLSTAQKMLADGLAPELIIKYTNISQEELNSINKNY